MSRRFIRCDQGFTLIEVLVATAVLAASVVALSTLFVTSSERILAARTRSCATILARARLEALLADPGLRVDGGAGRDIVDALGRPVAGGGGTYERRWSLTPLAADPGRLLLATVEVTTLADGRLNAGTVRLTTLTGRRP